MYSFCQSLVAITMRISQLAINHAAHYTSSDFPSFFDRVHRVLSSFRYLNFPARSLVRIFSLPPQQAAVVKTKELSSVLSIDFRFRHTSNLARSAINIVADGKKRDERMGDGSGGSAGVLLNEFLSSYQKKSRQRCRHRFQCRWISSWLSVVVAYM